MRKVFPTILVLFFSSTAFAQGVKPFLQKMFSDIPDNYGVKIVYVTGKEESFELASHTYSKETGLFEFVTKDDVWNWVPLSSVVRIEFDKRFSKIITAKEKSQQEKTEKPAEEQKQ